MDSELEAKWAPLYKMMDTFEANQQVFYAETKTALMKAVYKKIGLSHLWKHVTTDGEWTVRIKDGVDAYARQQFAITAWYPGGKKWSAQGFNAYLPEQLEIVGAPEPYRKYL